MDIVFRLLTLTAACELVLVRLVLLRLTILIPLATRLTIRLTGNT